MRILFIGDIVGSPGRQIVRDRLADIVSHRQIDLVIANGENSASGFGITPKIADDLLSNGVDVVTGGNHSWDRKEILEYMPHQPRLLRPGNFPEGSPGSGTYVGTTKKGVKFAVVNLQGRVFLPTIDGRVSVVVGTHTHVTTADERVLPQGTAYITDVGMTGPHDGVIGMDRNGIIKRFLDGLPARFDVAPGDIEMNCVLIETDDGGQRNASGRLKAKSIERLRLRAD